MLKIVVSADEIKHAQRSLEQTMAEEFPRIEIRDIGWQGGRRPRSEVRTDGMFWYCSNDFRDSPIHRRLNWFGVLGTTPVVSIAVEVNTPYEGRDERVAGFFARNTEDGTIYLIHSGRVGGGGKGISRARFLAHAKQPVTTAFGNDGRAREGIVVMPVAGKAAAQSALRFVREVVEFKRLTRASEQQ
ncbi:MAG TPA: hypothetical protein VHA82_10215 [Ramlibacter sp.]|uniref:hypothetical protein n=1 Tax=Ramlibacter sp. TaxID=1917967 RepID=UPI002BBAB739|nr:hypothetical protein [Ramlibacter sp.]HVZ44170.1 hypothetical protein [Ramlibacter sp.]